MDPLSRNSENNANNNNNNNPSGGGDNKLSKGSWKDSIVDAEHLLDSGHFTVSPDVEAEHLVSGESISGGSGSSRSHSPASAPGSQFSTKPPHSSTLVLHACRADEWKANKVPVPEEDTSYSSIFTGNAYSSSKESSFVELNQNQMPQMTTSTTLCNTSAEESDHDPASSSPSVSYLKMAIDNFNSLYQEKLKMVEDIGAQGDTLAQQCMVICFLKGLQV